MRYSPPTPTAATIVTKWVKITLTLTLTLIRTLTLTLTPKEAFGIVMRLEAGGSLEDHLYKLETPFSMADKVRLLLSRPLQHPHVAPI